MKHILNRMLCAAVLATAAVGTQDASAVELREHRAIWMTPYLSDWPTSAITTTTASRHKQILNNNLDRYKNQNVNIIYYHVRSMCDAAYDSKYEPWSKGVSGTRGKKPAFDPFEYLIQEAHARGIEVYAWLNPYRYQGVYAHEDTPLNYNNTHPEWLLVQSNESILNPALDEVQQRIVDVVMDIMDKYDIDGVVFDDYFYTSGTPASVDAQWYNEAKKQDPTIKDQNTWRRANVNKMISRVYHAIKERAPWMAFGISPAGVASPPNIRDYGLEPAPDSDWQYNGIASDPISWYNEGIVDYMSPQIYWPSKFTSLQQWWAKAAKRFNRHLYSSVSLSDFSKYGGSEFNAEANNAREILPENESGIVFFSHKSFVNAEDKIDGKLVSLGDQLGADAFSTPVLTPLRKWDNVYAPVMTANVKRDGDTLTWDEVPGMRYTVYSFAPGEQPMTLGVNLVQICYTNSLEIPESLKANTFGVCVYDRYGNEYSMLLEGATVGTAESANLTYPAHGQEAADLFDFTWEANGADNILEVANDEEFTQIIGSVSTRSNAVNSANIAGIEDGGTYFWRVRTHPVNAHATVSDTRSFKASRIAVTGPKGTEQPATPVITWTPAFEGSEYLVEIARKSDFASPDYSGTTTETSIEVPAGNLVTGYNYYVRVTATRDGKSSQSAVATFATADVIYDAPSFVNPASAGQTIHANEGVKIQKAPGLDAAIIQISTAETFPARSSYKITLRGDADCTPDLSTIKVGSKALVDGTTYYVRAYGQYFVQEKAASTQDTEYTQSTFVYSSELGVADVKVDAEGAYIDGSTLVLPQTGVNVAVYTADGTCVMSLGSAPRTVELGHLNAGFYIVRAGNVTLKWLN